MKKNIILIFAVLFSVLAYSQVGINTDRPNSNAGLHVSERKNPASTGVPDKYNGVMIQRYTATERDNITVATAENSMMIFNTTENCYNYWDAPELEWKSLCGNMGNAKFTFDCANVSLKGTYVKGKETDGTNYIAITLVNVTKPGAYLITASSNPENGYSFVGQGTLTTTGTQTIRLYAQGTPTAVGTNNFIISSSGSTSQTACTVPVTVNPDIAAYALNCSSITVNGNYVKGTALTASNTITMNVNVNTLGSYNISTPNVNGVTFSASGVFTSTGTQQITLIGSGTPTVNTDFQVAITANTVSGNATCSATIPVILPAMTYALIGNDGTYSWTGTRNSALNANFSPNGVVKIVNFTQAWSTNDAATATTNITNNPPDIIMYFSYAAPNSAALTNALRDYVRKGGVLIYASNSTGLGSPVGTGLTDAQTLINGIFNLPTSELAWQTTCTVNCPAVPNDDNNYAINILPNDPVINGPFGNLGGKYWGEDNTTTGTIVMRSLPAGSVQVAPANNNWGHIEVNPSYSTVWYNDNYNFFMLGDTVGVATQGNTDPGGYPSIFNNSTWLPVSKQYGNGDNTASPYVYNSALEMNAVAWGLKKAAVSGINPH
ncbi:hypothetical protein CLU97_2755 [Chryseobacterium sp. 7]|uniref:hypothetical protein n=1 Tax=Chryseobacterium sp. 7 TaxID=2035214 RepID=UPI000EB42214|nr:hypothetical protein [Chryseobacterium sp. 7]RLJ33275.1 hypothetical protein CLU97_2755 [Chryseobacterium sp. 7]